jgi:hypothetical protein
MNMHERSPNDAVERSPEITTETNDAIPLYLIPRTISDQIRSKGDSVFRILVERKFHHQYTVQVETLDDRARQLKQGESNHIEGEQNG